MTKILGIEIISKRLNNTEFEKVSDLLYNLMKGYDYGFTDSINFAFYNEMKLIKSKVRKIRPSKISKLKVVNNNLNNNSNLIKDR